MSTMDASRFKLVDMHCHLDRMCNAADVAREAAARGIGIFCATVTPQDAILAQKTFANCENVRVGVGLHPWWVANDRVLARAGTRGEASADNRISTGVDSDGALIAHGQTPARPNACGPADAPAHSVDAGTRIFTGTEGAHPTNIASQSSTAGNLCSCTERTLDSVDAICRVANLAAASPYIGEVGLDFSPAHVQTRSMQLEAFERIVRTCAENPCGARVVSIHAVQAAREALDILERHALTRSATCVFHWFSGTSDDFLRLRRLGCCVSVNNRMLATRRGREYARQMPDDRLLLETDAPGQFDAPYSASELEASLMRTLCALARLRGADEHELASRIAQASAGLLGL